MQSGQCPKYASDCCHVVTKQNSDLHAFKTQIRMHTLTNNSVFIILLCLIFFYYFPHEKKNAEYFSNNSYTGVFIKPRTVTMLRTLVQLRHRSAAS